MLSRYDATAGPFLVGLCLSMVLYGSLVVQGFMYYQTSKKDQAWIRWTVLYLVAMETAITGYDIHQKYIDDAHTFALASDRGMPVPNGPMTALSTMMSVNAILTVLVSTPVQLFFAWRIKVLGGPKLMLAIIAFAAFGSLAGGISTGILVPRGDEAEARMAIGWRSVAASFAPSITWLVMSAIADLSITGCLVYTLTQQTRRNSFQATDDLVTKIMRFAIETGLLTTLCTLAEAVLFYVSYRTFASFYFIPDFILSKVYANSLLATLNVRAKWKDEATVAPMSFNAASNSNGSTLGTRPVTATSEKSAVKKDGAVFVLSSTAPASTESV
ncbi:hypothetical protein PLEOSDRAFT_1105456 [Pleurotus ostreatus PC15]|uniref:DUF6534 domain-containing protein n=1 Tax=Pleurotus ostreatus (strain PC15) TaxID=1137138 RepID=A0A067NR22_PLEO1|nr:hypothetical protein PLEOSDRAFT_1105456 [Pleurotus ostreatus PC15]